MDFSILSEWTDRNSKNKRNGLFIVYVSGRRDLREAGAARSRWGSHSLRANQSASAKGGAGEEADRKGQCVRNGHW